MDKANFLADDQQNKSMGIPIFPVPKDAPKLSHANIYRHFVNLFNGDADHYYQYRNAQG